MIAWILLVLQLLCTVLNFFFAKTKLQRKLLLAVSYGVLIAWLIHHGYQDFISFSVWILLISLAASYLVYLLSLFIVGTKFNADNLLLKRTLHLQGKRKHAFARESLRNLYSATYEELIYRWFLQNALYEATQSAILSILITIVVFFAVHLNKKIAIVQKIDIFTFSIFITLFYFWTINPIYCIIIHILRNQLIICQKHVAAQIQDEKMRNYMKLLKGRTVK